MTFQILSNSTFVIAYTFMYILLKKTKNTDNHNSTFENKNKKEAWDEVAMMK